MDRNLDSEFKEMRIASTGETSLRVVELEKGVSSLPVEISSMASSIKVF